jgi:uncharacterized protein (TIGR03083 family)
VPTNFLPTDDLQQDVGMADIRATIRLEREALASDLEAIDETAWNTPSLCPGWTIRDVLAHMTALGRMTPALFFAKLVASGFSPSRLQARDITLEKGGDVGETLARFRSVSGRDIRLRAVPAKTALGESLLHAEDIRRPLGIEHQYPLDALVIVAEAYKKSNMVAGTKRRIAGLSLQATDIDWSTGSGPVVSGPMLALLMTMAGRHAAIEDLEGEGAESLLSRA